MAFGKKSPRTGIRKTPNAVSPESGGSEEHLSPTDVFPGIAAAFVAMAHPRSPEDAVHRSKILEKPIHTTFGEHRETRKIVSGRMNILKYLEGNDVVVVNLKDPNGKSKQVQIGATPTKYDPTKGGGIISGAGRELGKYPDDYRYLMIISEEGSKPTARYLSPDQMDGISVAPRDEDIKFDPRQTGSGEATQVIVSGVVESVIALR